MMRWSGTAGKTTLATFLMVGSLLMGAPSAQAVSCSAGTCDGKDPQATGCAASAITVADGRSDREGRLEFDLRYSTVCKTWWARFTSINTGTVGEVSVERAPLGRPVGAARWSRSGQQGWTRMFLNVPGYYTYRACGRWENGNFGCTQYYTKR